MGITLNVKEEATDSRVPVTAFVDSANMLLKLLREVETSISEKKEANLKWVISDLKKSSACMELVAVDDEELSYNGHDVSDVVTKGLSLLKNEPRRPTHFSNNAIKYAKELAKKSKGDTKTVFVTSGDISVELTPKVVTNIDALLKESTRELGTIEGILKMVTIAGKPRFNVYDVITGWPVKCDLNLETHLPIVAKAIGSRVSITGLVLYTADGYPKNIINVMGVSIFPEDNDLPSVEDVLSSGLTITGGLPFKEFMEKMHHDRR